MKKYSKYLDTSQFVIQEFLIHQLKFNWNFRIAFKRCKIVHKMISKSLFMTY